MKIAVLGAYQTKFGELWNKSFTDLLAESQLGAINDAGISPADINAIFTGTMCASLLCNQSNVGGIAADILRLSVPSTSVEGACASGGLAVRAGIAALESGQAEVVLVNGVEKMTDVSPQRVTGALMTASSAEWEQVHGATFVGLDAMIARLYMEKFGLTREELAAVSVQNHAHGFDNPKAHLRKKITIADVCNAPIIADPLTLFDCSPISDGAASLVLCTQEFVAKQSPEALAKGDGPVFITGSGQASDTLMLAHRDELTSWKSTRLAAEQAYAMAGVTPQDVDVVELHDAFSIVQLIALEDLGFFEPGQAGKAVAAGKTSLGGPLPVNPSGGLKSRGHPVGATGVAQVVEIAKQVGAGARTGVAHNVGGCGTVCVVHVLRSDDE